MKLLTMFFFVFMDSTRLTKTSLFFSPVIILINSSLYRSYLLLLLTIKNPQTILHIHPIKTRVKTICNKPQIIAHFLAFSLLADDFSKQENIVKIVPNPGKKKLIIKIRIDIFLDANFGMKGKHSLSSLLSLLEESSELHFSPMAPLRDG